MCTITAVIAALGAFGVITANGTAARADRDDYSGGWRRHAWQQYQWREHEWRERAWYARLAGPVASFAWL